MRFIFGCIIIACLFPAGVIAQDSFLLTGNIRDASNTPIPQAMIFIEGTNMGTYADNHGKYSLKITPGEHVISISAYGYSLQKHTITIKANNSLNFILKEQSIDISAVNVYGKSESQQLRESAFTVNAIEIKSIASNINNLNTTLAQSSGIKIREDGGVGSDYDLSINGLSGNSIRYFIDGIPLSSIGNGVSLANFPVNLVERIEVYKGVVPANLGSDALGGAVNIITKKDKQNYLDASYGIGSFCTHKADFNGQYVHPETGIFIQPSIGLNYSKNNYMMKGVRVKNSEGRFDTIDTKRFHDDYFSVLSQLKVGVNHKKWADLFLISTSYFHCDKELQTGSNQNWVYGMAIRQTNSYNLALQYLKDSFLIKGLTINLSASHTWDYKILTDTAYRDYFWDGSYTETSGNEISKDAKSIRHTERPLTIGRINLNYAINNKHSININYLLNYLKNNRYDDLDTDFDPSKDIFCKQIIGFSYNQKLWNDKLHNAFFFKDYISYLEVGQQDNYWTTGSDSITSSNTNNYGYGFSTRLQLVEQLAIKGSYEYAVRLPKAREYLGDGSTIAANFLLNPEHSNNINLGLFGTFHLATNHQLYYETGLFYRKVEDYIRYEANESEDGYGQYVNVDNVTVNGIEGELRYTYNNMFQVTANASYLDERNKTKYKDDGKISATYNNHIPNRPWLYGNLEFSFRKKDVFGQKSNQIKLSYYYQYVHWFYLTWEGYGYKPSKSTIPTQYLNNAQITYSIKNEKYNISLECNNILDQTLYDNYKMQKPGRSFFLKLRTFIN